ncbi:hypothetical protein GF340_04855 [Candidatus Peregrinibacteria bacterium]|nr:hypothetical protein [Candidatus Peregrinibacteria bacterium]
MNATHEQYNPILNRNSDRIAHHRVGINGIRRCVIDYPEIAADLSRWCIQAEKSLDEDLIPDYDKLHQIALKANDSVNAITALEKASAMFAEKLAIEESSIQTIDVTANTPTALEPVDVTGLELPEVAYIKRTTAKATEKIGHNH